MDSTSVYLYITEVKLYSLLWHVPYTSQYRSRQKAINYLARKEILIDYSTVL